jgi:hypothetical protein
VRCHRRARLEDRPPHRHPPHRTGCLPRRAPGRLRHRRPPGRDLAAVDPRPGWNNPTAHPR